MSLAKHHDAQWEQVEERGWARGNKAAQEITVNIYCIILREFEGGPVRAKSLQSCLTLCSLKNGSLPGSSVHSILQARTLEWVAISFSRGSSQLRDWTQVSCIAGKFFTAKILELQLQHQSFQWMFNPLGLTGFDLLAGQGWYPSC